MRRSLEPIRGAVERGEWSKAFATICELDPDTAATAEGLELRALAAYGAGHFEEAVRAWEDLHELQAMRADRAEAARAAAMAAMYLMMDTGLMAPVRGWLRRADQLLDGLPEAPASAVVAMTRAYERFMCGDMAAAAEQARRAIELGHSLEVGAAVIIGQTCSARVAIQLGDLDAGLAQLDEVGALLMAGATDPLTTGMMYCEIICAAQGLALHDLAAEWTEVMDRWRDGSAIGGITGRCRVHRAELLRLSGPCDEAEHEALAACEALRPWMRREFGWPLMELGTIRLRKGDLAGAQESFSAAERHGWAVQPGLALLRLAEGDTASAAGLVAEAIANPVAVPSKENPPFGDLRLAPLYDAQSEIAAATGDEAALAASAHELEAIAARYPSATIDARAELARARHDLASGRLEAALQGAQSAAGRWSGVGAPYEAAGARLVAGHALAAAGRVDDARREWARARDGFDAFGATRRADDARSLLDGGPLPAAGRDAATPGARGVFCLQGSTRVIEHADTRTMLNDLVGFRHIARLLADPGREFHALDLIAVERGSMPIGATTDEGHLVANDDLPVLDDQAREAYRRRLAEVDDDIEDARLCNDFARVELAERDRSYLIAEMRRAIGIGGRTRTTGGSAERARTSVTRSIRYALDRLGTQMPDLATHLRAHVRTGTYCCYVQDPLAAITWDTSGTDT